ncbi:MAG TPA: trypsin-like peptidase domain-containing protein [Solirubrobacteraceae bacterium]|nr:trypsin-like peptidase domain-containing protein [Solirubrobacteraceae bacterium]
MTARVAAVLVALAALVVAGCGGDGETRTVRTETTRVEVLQDAGGETRARGAFDPAAIYRRESPGVVTVISRGLGSAQGQGGGAGLGSGFVISGNGEIATNAHVVTSGEGAAIRKAEQVYVRFQDDNQVPAKIIGFDPFSDVALLRIDPRGLTLRPLPLGRTKDLVVGAPVAAIGSPFGEEQSLSVGVISALDRSIRSLTGFATVGAIQTDAAINHGNSGGPLLDASGNVLGINAQIQTSTGEGSGVGFAVSVDTVRRSLDQLRESGRARYAYLGVATSPVYPQLAERFKLPVDDGAWVQEVTPGEPADDAGLRGGDGAAEFQGRQYRTGGDVITAVGRRQIREEADVAKALVGLRPGAEVDLQVYRDGERRTVRVKLGERPLDAPRAG